MEEYINNLLQNVAKIQEEFDIHPDKSEEKFNVFSVMAMEHDEVNTHSAIIGELLNPNGSHGQGNQFLQIFLDEIRDFFKSDIVLDDFGTLVDDNICERTISLKINKESVSGGRIDLIVEDDKQILIIENKLYAIDQEYQLIRYNNYAKNKFKSDGRVKDILIFYLTLDGKELNDEKPYTSEKGLSIRGLNFIYSEKAKFKEYVPGENTHHCLYYPISYEKHIKNWLEKCLKEPELKPLLKATLEQYLVLVKKMTFQTMSEKLKNEIVDSILSKPIKSQNIQITNKIFDKSKNIRSAFGIVESIENLKKQLYDDLIIDLRDNTEGYKIVKTGHKEYYGVDVSFDDQNVIRVFFGKRSDKSKYCTSVWCGFEIKVESPESIKLYTSEGFTLDSKWIYKWINSGNWGNSPEIWVNVANGKVYAEIISVINKILEIKERS